MLWVFHHRSVARAVLQKRSLQEKAGVGLAENSRVASMLESWSQRVQVVPDNHVCVLRLHGSGAPGGGGASSVKEQLVNTLGLQAMVPASAAPLCHRGREQLGVYSDDCAWLCSQNT